MTITLWYLIVAVAAQWLKPWQVWLTWMRSMQNAVVHVGNKGMTVHWCDATGGWLRCRHLQWQRPSNIRLTLILILNVSLLHDLHLASVFLWCEALLQKWRKSWEVNLQIYPLKNLGTRGSSLRGTGRAGWQGSSTDIDVWNRVK